MSDGVPTLREVGMIKSAPNKLIAEAFRNGTGSRATIVHFNGSFHTDYGEGTAERTRRRLPGRRVAVISMIPVDDIDTVAPDEDGLRQADYLVFTTKK